DRPRSEGGAEPDSAAPQDFAFPVRKRLPKGLLLQQADRHAAQIQQLERQLAELTAAVQALRNEGRLSHALNHRESALTANRTGTSVISVDMEPLITEHVLVRPPAQIRARLHGDVKIARVEIDKPEVIQLFEQSPHEAVLVVGHAGAAIVKLWNNQDQVYTLRADVIQARETELASEADARRAVMVAKGYVAARQPANVPGRGDVVDTSTGEVVETLTRVKYKLSAGKAQALAAFLQQYGNDGVESRSEERRV